MSTDPSPRFELLPVHWKRQEIGLGVSRCPVDPDGNGQPLRCNMGYVERRDNAREQAWREAS